MKPADVVASANAALDIFAKEPFNFALKPVVKRVLQSIAGDGAAKQVGTAAADNVWQASHHSSNQESVFTRISPVTL